MSDPVHAAGRLAELDHLLTTVAPHLAGTNATLTSILENRRAELINQALTAATDTETA